MSTHAVEKCTYQVEAEDGKGQSAKQGKGVIEFGEQGVQERSDWGVDKDVQQDLQQPANAEHHAHKAKEALQVEGHHCDGPGVVRICALQQHEGSLISRLEMCSATAQGQFDE